MKIKFYKSAICPRCLVAQMALKKIVEKDSSIEIEMIDVVSNFKRYQADKIGMFPAIVVEDKILQGLLLTPSKIEEFIQKC